MRYFKVIVFVALLLSVMSANAAHIVGGVMYYECLGGNNYRITMKVYRDCYSSGPNVADFDDPAYVAIYDANGILIEDKDVSFTTRQEITAFTNNPCIDPPTNVCVEEAVYQFDYVLPPTPGGYDIVYTRCCRNATISNIGNPGGVGATYTVHIDPTSNGCNSSPYFNDFPPIVICTNEPLVFDHSATDPDGDSLVYSFCKPYVGADDVIPQPIPPDPPPFGYVTWVAPYNTNSPLTASPPLHIDPATGLLTGTPTVTGQYVVGICVREYRNGVLLGEVRRDFQFNVAPCIYNVRADIPVIDVPPGTPSDIKGVYSYECAALNVDFVNTSTAASFYYWDFGDLTTQADTSTAFQPSYTYPDTGRYVVTLIANPGLPCADTVKVIVSIYPGFNTDFDLQNACEDEEVNFTDLTTTSYGVVNSWNWSFGNGIVSQQQNPMYQYPDYGNYTVKLVSTNTKGCRDSITKIISIYDKPDVIFNTTPACVNTPFYALDNSVTNTGTITSLQWVIDGTPVGNNNILALQDSLVNTKNIKLIVTTSDGCIDSAISNVTFNPLPIAVAFGDTTVCARQPFTLSASGGATYQWSPASDLSNPDSVNTQGSIEQTTEYVVKVTDANLCTSTDTVRVNVNPLPLVDAGSDTFACAGNSIQLDGASDGSSYYWSPGAHLSDSTILTPVLSTDSSDTYTLHAMSQYGCQDSSAVFVEMQYPVVAVLSTEPELCVGDTIILSVSGGRYYQWLRGDILGPADTSQQPVSPPVNETYTVVAYNDCPQFSDTLDINVTVHPLPTVDAGDDDSIRRDEYTVIPATSSGIQFEWSPPDGLDDPTLLRPEASPFNTTTYTITATDFNGCQNQDSMTIFVEVVNLLLVPTAFSPNNDGVNDVFRIVRALNVEKLLDFSIYNRWGQRVFQTTDLRGYWDGTFKGEPQDLGVYVFYVKVLNRDGDKITRKGNVTLLR